MLDIKFIRENPDIVKKDLEKRKDKEKLDMLKDLLKIDEDYRKLLAKEQKLRHRRNELTGEINKAKKEGRDIRKLISEAKELPEKIDSAKKKTSRVKEKIDFYLMRIPNVLHESVPYGADEEGNVTIKEHGRIKKPSFELKPHGEVAVNLGGADFKQAAKVSGAGFNFLIGDLALLSQALMQFAIASLVKKGWQLVETPIMLNRKAYEGVTDLADFEDVMYKIDDEDLYLIATSEHPICALHMDSVFNEDELPKKYMGFSPCFRKEIGSRGVDTKGLYRLHQFYKIEQFVFCKPEDSWKIHEELLKNAEEIFRELGLPYRVINICTGDIGIVAAKKYDIEVWLPRQQKYGEVVSCSNCTAYQAVRSNIRYQKADDREYVHTLNSTAIATSRALVAILENFQDKDGSVKVPKVLRHYMYGKDRIKPEK